MIVPALRDEALLRDISSASSAARFAHLWWLGQSGYLLKWQDKFLLFDPYLSDALTKKYAGTKTEHVRMTARCLAPAQLDFVTLALASHAHTDHLDAETLVPLAEANQAKGARLRLILSPANIPTARQKLGDAPIDLVPLEAGATLEIDGFSISAIPSAHTELKQDAEGRHLFVGFIVRLGSLSIYHSGDTVLYPDLKKHLLAHLPKVMLLPINGHRPERGVAGNLTGPEAAELAKAVGAALAVPNHYDMFTFNTETPDEFVHACERVGQPYRVLKCGERLTLNVR